MKQPRILAEARVSYVTVIAVGVVLDRYVNYLAGGDPLLFGQPASVITTYIYAGVALVLWTAQRTTFAKDRLLQVFLAGFAISWAVHFLLYRVHGDAFNYGGLLYLPILGMLALKPPDRTESRQAILAFAWTTAMVLILTRVLEMSGVLAIRSQASGVVAFDEALYFLPLNDLLGIDGRWPGPFGHNGDTAMMAALLVVISVAFWTRASGLFIPVGVLTLILTNGRASIGAALVGLLILFMYTSNPRVARIPARWRVLSGGSLLVLGAVVMAIRPAGLTGRERIWPAFLELWWE